MLYHNFNPLTGSINLTGVISNEDSTDVTIASSLNKDFLKKRDNEDDDEVSSASGPFDHYILLLSCYLEATD